MNLEKLKEAIEKHPSANYEEISVELTDGIIVVSATCGGEPFAFIRVYNNRIVLKVITPERGLYVGSIELLDASNRIAVVCSAIERLMDSGYF